MKKTFLLIGLLALTTATLFAQNTLPRLAVVEFSTNVNQDKIKADAITVREMVESEMVKTRKYQIVTREDIDKLLANQRIQVSSISSAENLKKLELQNISYIVTGSVNANGSDYIITIRVLDVSTGQFAHSENDFIGSGSRDLFNGMNGLMAKFVAGMSSEGGRVGQTSQTYKVGDYGPAGGIIFYDKGVFSNGWRYLEAAPAETEFYAQFGEAFPTDNWTDNQIEEFNNFYGSGEYADRAKVGYGKRNTENMLKQLTGNANIRTAARLCDSLSYNGYSDWFLPSSEELELIDQNIKQNNLGNFQNSYYWSSSFHPGGWPLLYWFFADGAGREIYLGVLEDGEDKNSSLHYVRAIRQF